jgi:1-deoxy-D-xylulose-5-phosphate reductoisomerase
VPPHRRLIILGSTGSIGTQTVQVVRHLNALAERDGPSPGAAPTYEVVGLAAGSDAAALFAQASDLGVREVALASPPDEPPAPPGNTTLRTGVGAAERLVREVDADMVLSAIVGVAGLPATLAAVELGRDTAIANKETLVAAGGLVTAACAETGARLLPVDSEHAALWMCLAAGPDGFRLPPFAAPPAALRRAVLTASGGALRDRTEAQLANATPEDALAHPNWSMGAKVTIDTATLINKSFELVEAHWLFNIPAARLTALVHPQSLVHAIADFDDGSSIAQLGAPDMRTAILAALAAPARPPGCAEPLSLADAATLTFYEPDADRFPGITLGRRIIEEGGTAGAVANAANEAAVHAFVNRQIAFPRIAGLATDAIDAVGVSPLRDLRDATDADAEARRFVARALQQSDTRTRGTAAR